MQLLSYSPSSHAVTFARGVCVGLGSHNRARKRGAPQCIPQTSRRMPNDGVPRVGALWTVLAELSGPIKFHRRGAFCKLHTFLILGGAL